MLLKNRPVKCDEGGGPETEVPLVVYGGPVITSITVLTCAFSFVTYFQSSTELLPPIVEHREDEILARPHNSLCSPRY